MRIFGCIGGIVLRFVFLIGLFAVSASAQTEQAEDTAPPAAAQTEQAEDTAPPVAAADLSLSDSDLRLLTLPMREADLAKLADVWQEHLMDVIESNVQLNIALQTADDAQSKSLRAEIISTASQLNTTLGKYRTVLTEWGRKGADPDALTVHRKYADAVTAELFRVTDARALFKIAQTWLFSSKGGLGFVLKIAAVVLAFFIVTFIAAFTRRLTKRAVDRIPSLSNLLKNFVLKVVYWVTLAFGIVVILAIAGVNVTPLFAVFGGLSFILAFALQDTLGNLASGLMIMVLKPFDTGDFIKVAGLSGTVDDVSIIATTIRTFDNQIIVVPNSKVWGDVITNVNAANERRVDLVFGIGYSDSAETAIGILSKLVADNKLCLTDPEPAIFVGELGDSSVNIFCRIWVKTPDYWTVYWDMLSQAKTQFDAQGISIPFPQRDVHLYQVTGPKDE